MAVVFFPFFFPFLFPFDSDGEVHSDMQVVRKMGGRNLHQCRVVQTCTCNCSMWIGAEASLFSFKCDAKAAES